MLPAKLPHVLGSRPYALGCQRTHRPSDIISCTFSSSSSLRTFHSHPSSPRCHSEERQLPPHMSLLLRASFLPKISPLVGIPGPPTNSLPRFACDDCSDCGLSRWFPCSHHSLHPALLSTLTTIDSCFAALCRPVTVLATIKKNLRRIHFAMSRNTRETACTFRARIQGSPWPVREPSLPCPPQPEHR